LLVIVAMYGTLLFNFLYMKESRAVFQVKLEEEKVKRLAKRRKERIQRRKAEEAEARKEEAARLGMFWILL